MTDSPVIGITTANKDTDKYTCDQAYARAVTQAGGLPILLPQQAELAREYARHCDGLIFTGGKDPIMEWFGAPTDPRAKRVEETRQSFELALLEAAAEEDLPVLGICLGMQMMGLHGGGTLDQHLPDTLGEEQAATHQNGSEHTVVVEVEDSVIEADDGPVVSWHRQALRQTGGAMRIVARAPDGIVEAIDDPHRRFYAGVQWHPEKMAEDRSRELNHQLFVKLIDACRHARSSAASPPRR